MAPQPQFFYLVLLALTSLFSFVQFARVVNVKVYKLEATDAVSEGPLYTREADDSLQTMKPTALGTYQLHHPTSAYTHTATVHTEKWNSSTDDANNITNCAFDIDCLERDEHHYKMFVGILSAKRNPPTVLKMVEELLRPINRTGDYKLLVWRSESTANDTETAKKLTQLGASVVINTHPYPELAKERVKITFDDPLSKVIWRTSEVLDYANILELGLRYHSEFVLILEDDLKPAKNALDKSYQFANKYFSNTTTFSHWGLLTMYSSRRRAAPIVVSTGLYCLTGSCALLFRRNLIPEVINYLRRNPYEGPVDFMFCKFMQVNKSFAYERTPNLFQHISPRSSYTGSDQIKRNTERIRSISFEFDEDKRTGMDSKDGYLGCFKDDPKDEDFTGAFALLADGKGARSSPELCEDFCNGYFYFALQNGGDCYCGNSFGKHGAAPEEDCNRTCVNSTTEMCGGTLRNSVYKITFFYSLVGCFVQKNGTKVVGLSRTSFSPETLHPLRCQKFCKNRPYFAIQGGDCICVVYSQLIGKHTSMCSQRCGGNLHYTCGGKPHYMSLYKSVHADVFTYVGHFL